MLYALQEPEMEPYALSDTVAEPADACEEYGKAPRMILREPLKNL